MDNLTVELARDGFVNNIFTARELVTHYIARIRKFNNHLPSPRDASAPGLSERDSEPLRSELESATKDLSLSSRDSVNLNAILAISDTALDEADALDAAYADSFQFTGALHGIPIILRDSIATAGLATTYGSLKAKDNVPDDDATVVKKLKEAGAIILAKSTLPDWSASWHCTSSLSGTTKNPHDLRRDPSSGAAAAISADLAILGLDTDTGGSVRLPASFCSLVGFRPRPGLISRYGIPPQIEPQDTPGPICKTVRDVAVMFDVMFGYDPQDPSTVYTNVEPTHDKEHFYDNLDSMDVDTLRIGVVENLYGPDDDPVCAAVNERVRTALDRLRDQGADIRSMRLPHIQQHFRTTSLYANRSASEINNWLKDNLPQVGTVESMHAAGEYHPAQDLFEVIAQGHNSRLDPAYAFKLERHISFRTLIMNEMQKEGVDFLAFPTCQVPSPLTEDILNKNWKALDFPTNTVLAAQAVLPAISVPVGATDEGLPVGLELVGIIYQEKRLLDAASVIERCAGERVRPRLK